MGGFDLTSTAKGLDKGGKKTDDAIMANTAKVFEEGTREEVERISRKMRCRRTRAGGRKRIGRREKKASTSHESELLGGEGKGRRSRKGGKPGAS